MKTQEKQLFYLDELPDYEIESGYPDVRGWVVKDSALRNVGTVKNLLVNKLTEKVVYLDVEVDSSIIDAQHDPYGRPASAGVHEFINAEGENHIIIPVGLADLNHEEGYVFTESIDNKTFAETKRKRSDAPIDRDYETAVLGSYGKRYAYEPLDKRVDSDIESAALDEKLRMRKIKQRHRIGEYRDEEPAPDVTDDAVDWYDAGSESLKSPEEVGDDFYRRREFDDAKFRKGKKDSQ